MLETLIGAGLKVGGSIFGGLKASQAMKRAKRNIERQKRENQAWYDRRYNEDATQRADARRLLSMTEDSIRRRNEQAAGTQAVMGGTDESVAATKAAGAQALADATSTIAAKAAGRKDAIEEQYLGTDRDLDKQLANLEVQKAQAIGQAVKEVTDIGGQMLGVDDATKPAQQ